MFKRILLGVVLVCVGAVRGADKKAKDKEAVKELTSLRRHVATLPRELQSLIAEKGGGLVGKFPFLMGLIGRGFVEPRTFEGHASEIIDVKWSKNGQLVASASEDGQIRIWDVASAECTRILQHPLNRYPIEELKTISWNDDSESLVSGGGHLVKVWRVSDGVCTHTFDFAGDRSFIYAVDWRGPRIVVGGRGMNANLVVWNVQTEEREQEFDIRDRTENSAIVNGVQFNRDGSKFVETVRLGDSQIRDSVSGVVEGRLELGVRSYLSGAVDWNAITNMIAVGDKESIAVWNPIETVADYRLQAPGGDVKCVRWEPAGHSIASTDGLVLKIFGVQTRECIAAFDTGMQRVGALDWDPTGTRLDWDPAGTYIVFSVGNNLKIWRAKDYREAIAELRHPSIDLLLLLSLWESDLAKFVQEGKEAGEDYVDTREHRFVVPEEVRDLALLDPFPQIKAILLPLTQQEEQRARAAAAVEAALAPGGAAGAE